MFLHTPMGAPLAPQNLVPPPPRCPACGCEVIDRIARRGLRDYLASILSLYPFLCRRCGHEFYLPHRGTEEESS